MNTNEMQNEVKSDDQIRELTIDELNIVGGGAGHGVGAPGAGQLQ